MPKTNRGIDTPYIVRVGVKTSEGYWTQVSIDAVLMTAIKHLAIRRGISDPRELVQQAYRADDRGVIQDTRRSVSRTVAARLIRELVIEAGIDPGRFDADLKKLAARFVE